MVQFSKLRPDHVPTILQDTRRELRRKEGELRFVNKVQKKVRMISGTPLNSKLSGRVVLVLAMLLSFLLGVHQAIWATTYLVERFFFFFSDEVPEFIWYSLATGLFIIALSPLCLLQKQECFWGEAEVRYRPPSTKNPQRRMGDACYDSEGIPFIGENSF